MAGAGLVLGRRRKPAGGTEVVQPRYRPIDRLMREIRCDRSSPAPNWRFLGVIDWQGFVLDSIFPEAHNDRIRLTLRFGETDFAYWGNLAAPPAAGP